MPQIKQRFFFSEVASLQDTYQSFNYFGGRFQFWDLIQECGSYRLQGLCWPFIKPVNGTAVDEGGELSQASSEDLSDGARGAGHPGEAKDTDLGSQEPKTQGPSSACGSAIRTYQQPGPRGMMARPRASPHLCPNTQAPESQREAGPCPTLWPWRGCVYLMHSTMWILLRTRPV